MHIFLSLKVKTYGTETFTVTVLQNTVLFFVLLSSEGCSGHEQASTNMMPF